MQLSNSCLPYLFCSLLTLHVSASALQREGPRGLGLPCPVKVAREWASWRQSSCAGKDDEIGTHTQQGISNDLGETMWQAGRFNRQGAQAAPGLWKKNTFFFFVLLVLLPCLLPVGCDGAQRWSRWLSRILPRHVTLSSPFIQGCACTRSSSWYRYKWERGLKCGSFSLS